MAITKKGPGPEDLKLAEKLGYFWIEVLCFERTDATENDACNSSTMFINAIPRIGEIIRLDDEDYQVFRVIWTGNPMPGGTTRFLVPAVWAAKTASSK
jgi:hypothetical protein